MKDKRVMKVHDNVERVKRFAYDYVCLLDDPTMRRIALTMGYAEAKRILQNKILYHTEYDRALQIVAHVYAAFIDAITPVVEVASECVDDNRSIGIALYDLALNISTRNDRIVACRKIDKYPWEVSIGTNNDATLDNHALYIAGIVDRALNDIGEGMEQLRVEKAKKAEGAK